MTEILNLPKLSGDGTAFVIDTNADWSDTIFFPSMVSPAQTIHSCSMDVTSNGITVLDTTSGLVPGQPVIGPGIPPGAFIGTVVPPNLVTLVDEDNFVVYTTATLSNVNVIFQALGIDLGGIDFVANLRLKPSLHESVLTVRTTDGSLLNGGKTGTLGFNVLESVMEGVPPNEYVMDIVAVADDQYVNLFPDGPATVIVLDGVTDPDTLT